VDYHVTKPVLKVHTARTVTTSVNATMEPSVLLNLVCVYVLLGGEDSNAICRVKNHFTVKIVKTNVNVKTMQRVVPSTVNTKYLVIIAHDIYFSFYIKLKILII